MADVELHRPSEPTPEAGVGAAAALAGGSASGSGHVSNRVSRASGGISFARLILRASLPFIAAALVSVSSFEPHLAPRATDPILFEDQAPPAPRRVPKSDPDLGHSLALLPA